MMKKRLAEGNLTDLFKLADIIVKTMGKNVTEIVNEILYMLESKPVMNKS